MHLSYKQLLLGELVASKVLQQYLLKMQSEKVWNVVEFGWSPPKVLDREGRPTNVIKLKLEWDRDDNEASENNARAMYSIFNAISTDEFRRIATCTSAKEAWDILQVTHEGTNAMKVSKLQMLTSRFETIRIEDHENFREFYAKLIDIVNSRFNIGEPIPNSKVVRKILRSLSERFRAKVTAIEESKDVDSLKVVGSLQTFEMTLGSPRKSKGIALNAIKEESLGSEGEGDEKMSDRKFGEEGISSIESFISFLLFSSEKDLNIKTFPLTTSASMFGKTRDFFINLFK